MIDILFTVFSGFRLWLEGLSFIEYIYLLAFPIVFDYSRSYGKIIILLGSSIYHKIRPIKFDLNYTPRVSILIPAHNEESSIVKTIESALETNYSNLEIVVIDDGSTDKTYIKAKPFEDKGLIKIAKREKASGTKAGAINYGLWFATGEIITVVDADTLIERNAIQLLVKQFSRPNVVAVSGNVRILSGDGGVNSLISRLQQYEYLLSLEMGRRFNAIMNMLIIIPGALGAFKREAGNSIGLFDTDTFTEDFDITVKIRKIGGRISFAERAISWTYCPSSWRVWIKQRIRWAGGQTSVLRKHGDTFRKHRYPIHLVVAFYDMVLMDMQLLVTRTIWLLTVFTFFSNDLLYVIILMMIIYFINEGASFIYAGLLSPRKKDLKMIYLLPVMVLFYRPFYGFVRLYGYFLGLLNKQKEW